MWHSKELNTHYSFVLGSNSVSLIHLIAFLLRVAGARVGKKWKLINVLRCKCQFQLSSWAHKTSALKTLAMHWIIIMSSAISSVRGGTSPSDEQFVILSSCFFSCYIWQDIRYVLSWIQATMCRAEHTRSKTFCANNTTRNMIHTKANTQLIQKEYWLWNMLINTESKLIMVTRYMERFYWVILIFSCHWFGRRVDWLLK